MGEDKTSKARLPHIFDSAVQDISAQQAKEIVFGTRGRDVNPHEFYLAIEGQLGSVHFKTNGYHGGYDVEVNSEHAPLCYINKWDVKPAEGAYDLVERRYEVIADTALRIYKAVHGSDAEKAKILDTQSVIGAGIQNDLNAF